MLDSLRIAVTTFAYPVIVSAAPVNQLIPLFERCASNVAPKTLETVIHVESGGNPFAIAVVNGSVKQPTSLSEAISTAKQLEDEGKNYSVGLMQVNKHNFKKYGLTPKTAFDACQNIRAGASILAGCFTSAKAAGQGGDQVALRKAMSCYYSGNFTRGFKKEQSGKSYVDRVEYVVERYTVPPIKRLVKTNSSETDSQAVENQHEKTISQPWDTFGDFS